MDPEQMEPKKTECQVVTTNGIYQDGLPPPKTQDAIVTHEGLGSGFPTENGIILVVTVTGRG